MIIKVEMINEIEKIDNITIQRPDIITVNLNDLEHLVNVDALLKQAQLCIVLENRYTNDKKALTSILETYAPNYIQFLGNEFLSKDTLQEIEARGIGVIYQRNIDCDDDVFWALPVFSSDFDEAEIASFFTKNNFFIQLNLMANYENRWEMLRNECGKYEEDLTIEDVNIFMQKYNSLIEINFEVSNVLDIIHNFPALRGIVLHSDNASEIIDKFVQEVKNQMHREDMTKKLK
jgi:hypothetical protein